MEHLRQEGTGAQGRHLVAGSGPAPQGARVPTQLFAEEAYMQRWTVEVSDTPEHHGMREKGITDDDLRRAMRDVADRSLHFHP